MKKIMCIILFVASGLLTAQNKKVVTTNGEIVNYDIRVTTAQRDALPTKTVGLLIFNTTTNCHEYWDGTDWYNYCWKGTTPPPVNPPLSNLPSSGGTAVVTAYNCSTAWAGYLKVGITPSGVTQTITATVASEGTYNIFAVANGVTFSGTGTFTGIGAQTVVLTATGTPVATGTFSYTLSTSPSCSFSRYTESSINGVAGKIWMDRNLGASQAATTTTDYKAYGSLYQWGRGNDGHQLVNWTSATSGTAVNGTTTSLSSGQNPGHPYFIVSVSSSTDWRSGQDNSLWQGYSGANNPCPSGFRVPTAAEYNAEFSAAGISNAATAFAKLKFTSSGAFRSGVGGAVSAGNWWTMMVWNSTPVIGSSQVQDAGRVTITSSSVNTNDWNPRMNGFEVRCLRD